MNKKFATAAVVALAALTSAGAFAQSQNHLYGEAALVAAPATTTSGLTRAQVQADYLQARRSGTLAVSQEGAFAAAPAEASSVTRAAVRDEASHYVILDGSNRKMYR
ncbi:MAG: hypothetical protein JWQ72_3570 [Polaromonas sp.]|nr:hypothetical protein [Polaromonas sp.]